MPRKSKKAGDDDSESAPVRRSTRARKSVLVNEDPDDFDLEPPKKVARGKRTSSWNVSYDEEDSNDHAAKTKDDEFDPDDDNDEEEKSTRTPVKGRGRGRKPAEHKDTPAPSRVAPKGRGKKRQQAESLKEEDSLSEGQETDSKPLPPSTPKKAKREEKVPTKETDDVEESAQSEAHSADAKKNTPKKNVAEDAEKESTPSDTTKDSKSKVVTPEKKTNEKVSPSTDASKDSHQSVSSKGDESASKENGVKSAEVKEPSGKESNAAVGSLKDVTVATAVLDGPKETKETLEKLENPDIVAAQKSTSASAEAAKTCGFKVVGDGPTRVLLRSGSSIELKGTPERISLRKLALEELKQISSESNRKHVQDYVMKHSTVNDELTVVTLVSRGKQFTLLNIQMESKNVAVSALLIGCVMRHFDSKPHAFVITGHMPYVRPGTPAYELLRDGYFGNHSIETLQMMQDIKLDDDDDDRGLIDFLWKAYQHSRPWMRSVYETVLKAESVVSSTGCGMLWHSTMGIDVVEVLNDAKLVKADLAIKT